MQLHPHFLFNTLHAISALMHRDVEAADRTMTRLSDLLRLTIESAGVQEVPLRQEVEFLERYLDIQKTRFSNRLTVKLVIDPATLDALVPNLILQPLVENAIRHSIASRATAGRVEIRARRTGGMLELEVRDDGPGLPENEEVLEGRGGSGKYTGTAVAALRKRAPLRAGQCPRGRAVRNHNDSVPRGGGMKISALIVDDEPLARERIRTLVRSDHEIAGECSNGRAAAAAIRKQAPQLLFLDVQMPDLDGFGVLEAIGPEQMPVTIFDTAYDQYALRAFEVHALDYLLKPFDRERFERAVARAKKQIRRPDEELHERLLALLEELKPGQKYLDRLVFRGDHVIHPARRDAIDAEPRLPGKARRAVGEVAVSVKAGRLAAG